MTRFSVLVLATLSGIGAAAAQEAGPALHPGIVDEVRAGINAHRASADSFTDVSDLSLDVLFPSPDLDLFEWLGSPRPELGATLNFAGEESLVRAALVWQFGLFETPFYVEGALGGAVHNGYLNDAPEGSPNLGCRANFYERIGVGMHVGDNATATLTYEHMSNANLCPNNGGISNLGLRLGWKF